MPLKMALLPHILGTSSTGGWRSSLSGGLLSMIHGEARRSSAKLVAFLSRNRGAGLVYHPSSTNRLKVMVAHTHVLLLYHLTISIIIYLSKGCLHTLQATNGKRISMIPRTCCFPFSGIEMMLHSFTLHIIYSY